MSLPSASVQLSEIRSSTNSSIIFTFLMGSYAVVYIHTFHLYLIRKQAPQRLIVLGAITVLFLIAAVQFVVQLYIGNVSLPQTNSNLRTAYVELFQIPIWTHVALNVTSYAMYIVADGLLIWRCFHVYGGRWRVIALPLLLLSLEIGLVTASIVYFLVVDSDATQNKINISNDIQSATFFMSFATSVSTTGLIAYQIYASSRNINGTRKRFLHILEIIIQSAAVYSAVLLVAAVSGAIPDGDSWPTTAVFALANYSSALLAPAAGIAPTVMAARVAEASSQEEHSRSILPKLSQLEFHKSNGSTMGERNFNSELYLTFSNRDSSGENGDNDKQDLA
ncbi:hypothetical protein JR316_0012695 [Psilocybe cubensis]|uniref:Uncharacterized protein n=2 Tax=Psilocybe cubensis TaxID=181762 RepID=A0ACB8GIP8_PSICU|nr:hypothetical protein JR316_0012695 [Psilocybe cubensis]KAH9475578.1 hypothetical protein JR316_0012695 [Psilocybe cubensis]